MRILSLRSKHSPTPAAKADMLGAMGIVVIDHTPTLFSALASMKIASLIDKEDISVIEVGNIKDAMAAVSARELARKRDVAVVVNIAPNTQPPKGVTGEIRRKVDAWIFPSARMLSAFPPDIRNATVIPTTSFAYSTDIPAHSIDHRMIAWIGDITRPDRLKAYLEEAEATESDWCLRVSGAGDAPRVMPVVRMSRNLTRNKDIVWVGEEYDTVAEIEGCGALLATDDDITEAEAAAILSGRVLLQPGDIGTYLNGGTVAMPQPPTPAEYLRRYVDVIRSAVPR